MILIRPATLDDLDILHSQNKALALESEGKELDDATLRLGITALLEDAHKGRYFIAESDGQVAGQVMLTVEWSDWRNGPMWWFQSVYVQPDYRRQGVFAALYNYVLGLAKTAGVKELRLYVDKGNVRARQAYLNLGMAEGHYDMLELTV